MENSSIKWMRTGGISGTISGNLQVFFFKGKCFFSGCWICSSANQRGARLFAQHPGGTDVLRDAAGHDVLGTQGARCNGWNPDVSGSLPCCVGQERGRCPSIQIFWESSYYITCNCYSYSYSKCHNHWTFLAHWMLLKVEAGLPHIFAVKVLLSWKVPGATAKTCGLRHNHPFPLVDDVCSNILWVFEGVNGSIPIFIHFYLIQSWCLL